MSHPLAYSAAANPTPGSERRMRGRVRQQGVMSTAGVVIDLSASGMRVLSTRANRGERVVHIWTEAETLSLRAEAVWTRRIGFRRHLAGFRFHDLDGAAMQKLSAIAASHRMVVPA